MKTTLSALVVAACASGVLIGQTCPGQVPLAPGGALGACCLGGECVGDIDQTTCEARGGVYLGDGAVCPQAAGGGGGEFGNLVFGVDDVDDEDSQLFVFNLDTGELTLIGEPHEDLDLEGFTRFNGTLAGVSGSSNEDKYIVEIDFEGDGVTPLVEVDFDEDTEVTGMTATGGVQWAFLKEVGFISIELDGDWTLDIESEKNIRGIAVLPGGETLYGITEGGRVYEVDLASGDIEQIVDIDDLLDHDDQDIENLETVSDTEVGFFLHDDEDLLFVVLDVVTLAIEVTNHGQVDLEDVESFVFETKFSCPEPTCVGAQGDCFEANGSPGCDDLECCEAICAVDPFCCDNTWDDICAEQADVVCGGGLPCPGKGECCAANDSVGCDDQACCEQICTQDPFCCENEWDGTCAAQAQAQCGVCATPGSDCCFANRTPGCDDPECEALVCGQDPFCCANLWDGVCANAANALCGICMNNDACADALPIANGTTEFSNVDATSDGPSPCGLLGSDLWYAYTSAFDGVLTVDTGGSGFDTALAAYDGCGCPASPDNLLACNDDAPGQGLQSSIEIPVVAGGCYLIQVGGFNGAQGDGVINVSKSISDCCIANGTPGCDDPECEALICGQDPFCCSTVWDGLCAAAAIDQCEACMDRPTGPSNDDCADAITIFEGDTTYSTIGATTDGDPLPPECDESFGTLMGADIWYVYNSVCDGFLSVSTCDQADYDTRLAAYSGECGNRTLIACNDDGPGCGGFTSFMVVPVVCDQSVLIRVGGFGDPGAEGAGTLSVNCSLAGCGSQACAGDTNGDGVVDVLDMVNVIVFWGTAGQGEGVTSDVDGSGLVDVLDMTEVILAWGPC